MIKTHNKVVTEENTSNIIKAICGKSTANIIFSEEEKTKAFPFRLRNKTRMPILITFSFNTILEVLATRVRQGKRKKKRIPVEKKR